MWRGFLLYGGLIAAMLLGIWQAVRESKRDESIRVHPSQWYRIQAWLMLAGLAVAYLLFSLFLTFHPEPASLRTLG